jgi:zinc protease
MKNYRLPLTVALLLPLGALAASYPRAEMKLKLKEYSVETRDFTFPSGLRVLFQADHSQPIVSITSFVDHGSSSDPEGLEGIAHVVEHMWFQSRHPLPDGTLSPKVWNILKDVGANLNASTAADWTNYMTVAPKEQIVPLMRLEALRLQAAVNEVTTENLLIEREVIRNELRLRYENGGADAFGYLYAKLFPKGHPYARLGIGTHDSLNAITLPDVQKFVKDYYRPEYTTITVVGDFELSDVNKLLDEFPIELLRDPKNPTAELQLVEAKPRITGPPIEPPPPPMPVLQRGDTVGITVESSAVESPNVVIGWSMPSGYRREDVVAQLAMNTIASAMQSEMFPWWEWDKKEKPVKGMGCFADPQKAATIGVCWIELRPEQDPVKIADSALNGLYNAWMPSESLQQATGDPWAAQKFSFDYAKNYFMAQTFRTVDLVSSLSGRATTVASWTHYTGSPAYFSDQFKILKTIQPEEVREYAKKYLNKERAVAVVLMPREEGDVDIASTNMVYRGARRDGAVDSSLTEADLPPERIAKTVVPIDNEQIKMSKLPNGMGLVVMPYSQAPLVEVAVKFRGGQASFDWGRGMFAANMWADKSGLSSMTSDTIMKVVGWDYALSIAGEGSMDMGDLSTVFHTAGSAANVQDAVFFLRDRIDQLTPYTNGKLDWATQMKVAINDWMSRPDTWAGIVMDERLMPNHYLSRWTTHADIDMMSKWNADLSKDVWSRILRPENADIFIVGNISVEEATKAANDYFGTWTGWGTKPEDWSEPNTDFLPLGDPPKRQLILIDKPTVSQTEVNYACQLEPVTDDGNPTPGVLGDVLSEGAWLALREETGNSYGAGAYAVGLPGGITSLRMSVAVQNDAAAEAAKIFIELGERAKAGRLDPRLLAIQKFNRAQGVVQGHQSVSQTMNTLLGAWDARNGYAFWDTYGQRLASVTIPQLSALMPRCVGHEVITLLGPVSVVEPQVKATGLPYEIFDWQQAARDYRASMGLKEPKAPKSGKKK